MSKIETLIVLVVMSVLGITLVETFLVLSTTQAVVYRMVK